MTPFFNSISPIYLNKADLDQLLALGWYRMHQTLFTCSHIHLNESVHRVHWLRFSVADVTQRVSHRKIKKRNKPFRVELTDLNTIDVPHQQLHRLYRNHIDFDGAESIQECLFGEAAELNETIFDTKCISIYEESKLIAAGYFDVGEKSAASILHFYHPDYARYSLGKYLILITLGYLQDWGIDYYYPGYIVEDIRKMDYKLFLGASIAEYFDLETMTWKKFDRHLLTATE